MAQNTYNFTLHDNETHREVVVFRDSQQRLSLRGYSAVLSVMNKSLPYGYEVLRLTTGDGGIELEQDDVLDDEQSRVGTLSFIFQPAQIRDMLWQVASTKQLVYTLTLYAPSSGSIHVLDSIPVLGGTITIKV